MKRLSRFFAVILIMVMVLPFVFIVPVAASTTAQNFNDVPPSHFAFDAINWVSNPTNGGFMVGDLAGNFHPSQTMTNFEAARIFAMAAGFRSAAHPVSPELRAEINRSFDEWRPFIDTMAAQNTQWSRIADREIAFLLYRGVLTEADVATFIGARLTRQEAATWMVRLIGQQTQAAAINLPVSEPFADNASISPMFIRYVYYARAAGIISGNNNNMFNPSENVTRAQLAVIFYNTLGGSDGTTQTLPPGTTTPVATVSGVVELLYRNTQLFIASPMGPQNYIIAHDAIIVVDHVQRSAAFIRTGMTVNAVLNAQSEIISLVARTTVDTTPPLGSPPSSQLPPTLLPPNQGGLRLYADEGFIVSVTTNPATVTVRTQRVRITGQIVDEVRTFTVAHNALITRGGVAVPLSNAQVNDIAFFRFNGTTIHELEMEERERSMEGVLLERRLIDLQGNQAIVIESPLGARYELRVAANTVITRGTFANVRLQDLRIGDSVHVTIEGGVMTRLHAVGERSIIEGRLTELRITQNFSEVRIQDDEGHVQTYTILPGTFDVYALRIGMDVRFFLDSWEVLDVQVITRGDQQPTAVLGNIQSITAGQTLVVVQMDGNQPRAHTVVVNNQTTITGTGMQLNLSDLRVNMNVYVVFMGPQSNVARSIIILP
ncbi:MAG: S-layer homology domain-containing protein [Defluviitaleaceae bacterium]|nr:S-layer homology domain-containing protein [Defluviitaleaceae bacterium]